MKALNLTLHNTKEVYPDIIEPSLAHKDEVKDLLVFDLMGSSENTANNVERVAQIADKYDTKSVIIDHTLHCRGALESALKSRDIELFDSIAQWEINQLQKEIETIEKYA